MGDGKEVSMLSMYKCVCVFVCVCIYIYICVCVCMSEREKYRDKMGNNSSFIHLAVSGEVRPTYAFVDKVCSQNQTR